MDVGDTAELRILYGRRNPKRRLKIAKAQNDENLIGIPLIFKKSYSQNSKTKMTNAKNPKGTKMSNYQNSEKTITPNSQNPENLKIKFFPVRAACWIFHKTHGKKQTKSTHVFLQIKNSSDFDEIR